MEFLRDMSFLSILIRMLCALICGGVIGLERELKGKYAGFRTHIMICIAAAMTTAISQYMLLVLHQYTDVARLGAGVAAGLGFIGAGTIVVTQGFRIKGLTTAAGLWATGIIGLCAGAGFFEGALITAALILFAESVVEKIEKKQFAQMNDIHLDLIIKERSNLQNILKSFKNSDIEVDGLSIDEYENNSVSCHFTIKLNKKSVLPDIISELNQSDFVYSAKIAEE